MMIVFVAGMPRAGSMWTYNVVRAIFETKNISVLPEIIPEDERNLIKSALLSEQRENEVYCIKTHLALKTPFSTKHEVKIISNIRDVRDACLSYMRFMHVDLEMGIQAMLRMMRTSDYYSTTFGDNLLSVRFEDVTNNPLNALEEICTFLKIDLSNSEEKEILKKFSKPTIQKKLRNMSKIKIGKNGQIEGAEEKSKFDSIRNLDGTYRLYEKNTAFQSNHITSTKDGEWRKLFDKNRTDQLIQLSKEWLLRYGYKV
jgi:Sulfotransferase domain